LERVAVSAAQLYNASSLATIVVLDRKQEEKTMSRHMIYGVHVQNRGQNALQVQQLLTEYGCHIKTRLGLHEVDEKFCSTGGILLLEMFGDLARCVALRDKLNAIDGIEVKEMIFEHAG
jgi:hypothetical protein